MTAIARPRLDCPPRPWRSSLTSMPIALLLAACASSPLPPHPKPVTGPAPAAQAPLAAPPPVSTPVPVQPDALPARRDDTAALRTWIDQQNRLYRVAAPLLIDNAELCASHARNLLGFTAKNRYSYGMEFADAAHAGLGLGERLQVMNVLPGSGAAQAGIREGDILLAAELAPLPQGANAEHDAATLVGSLMQGRDDVILDLSRDGVRTSINVPLTRACAFGIELGNAAQPGVYADGSRVMVTRGMLGFVQSDEELAYVLADGIAQDMLAAAPRAGISRLIDSLRTLVPEEDDMAAMPATGPDTPQVDASADTLALYLLVRAGHRIDHAPAFWMRLAGSSGSGGQSPLRSPSDRYAAMKETIAAIATRQAEQQPLVP